MATPNIVPRADSEGGLGTASKYWASAYIDTITTTSHINLPDDAVLKLGTGGDLRVYHDGSNSYIEQAGNGSLIITQTADDSDIVFKSDDGSGGVTAYLTLDGSKARTVSNQHLQMADGKALYVGETLDAGFYHSGGHNFLEVNSGNLTIVQSADDGDIIFQSDDGSGGVETYFFLEYETIE